MTIDPTESVVFWPFNLDIEGDPEHPFSAGTVRLDVNDHGTALGLEGEDDRLVECTHLALPDESGNLHHFMFTRDDWTRLVSELFDATIDAMGRRK